MVDYQQEYVQIVILSTEVIHSQEKLSTSSILFSPTTLFIVERGKKTLFFSEISCIFLLNERAGNADEKATRKIDSSLRWGLLGAVQAFKLRRFHPLRCGKVLWNVGRFSWDGFANRQRKTDTGIVQVKREQMLWETSKAPWRTCLGSNSTKPLISK